MSDPDLLRRLLQVHEDLQALIASANPPLPAYVPHEFPPAGLWACAEAIVALTQAPELDPAALRKAYNEVVAFNAKWQEEVSRIEPFLPGDAKAHAMLSERISAWRARAKAMLERVLAGLRELVILTGNAGPGGA